MDRTCLEGRPLNAKRALNSSEQLYVAIMILLIILAVFISQAVWHRYCGHLFWHCKGQPTAYL